MTDSVAFRIVAPGGEVDANHYVILNMQLTNTGQEKVFVNCRFAAVPDIGDVWLTITSADREIPFPFRVRLVPLKPSDFVGLEPGESVVAGVNLTKQYRLNQAGAYKISAEYVSSEVPDALAKERVFKGRTAAEPVTLVLK